jgi:CRP-like cAMP-binding protein
MSERPSVSERTGDPLGKSWAREGYTMPPNRILGALTPKDNALLRPHLKSVDLRCCSLLQAKSQHVRHVYFIEAGVVSVFAGTQEPIEIGMVGYEGMSGVAAVLGDGVLVPYGAFVQIEGRAQRIAPHELRAAMNVSASLTALLLLYANDFVNQLAQGALANGLGTVEERLARWLLMAADRMEGSPLPVTHEDLAAVLAVRRSGVSVALGGFEDRGLIARRRGLLSILDRKGLERCCSKGAYVRPAPRNPD